MNKRGHSKLWLYFSGIVFAAGFTVFTIVTLVWLLLFELKIIETDLYLKRVPILLILIFGTLLGGCITFFVGRNIIRPIQNMSDAFEELSKGNFDVKIPENERVDEIREIIQHFNRMTYDLSHIETLRNDFVADVSHEFKTPIASIEGYATLLQDERLTPERRSRYVEKILDNSRKLSGLCSNILMLSKLENQELVPNKREYRLDEQIRKAVLMLENRWNAKNIEFDIELEKQVYFGSEELIAQVWSNIIDNAIRYSPIGGVIGIRMNRGADFVTVTITDRGEGMSEEVQKHIFDKFYQADPSRKTDGSGLGLSLVKRILDICGGEISVDSAVGKGAAFTVSLSLS